MAYQFDFAPVLAQGDLLLKGRCSRSADRSGHPVRGSPGRTGAVARAWRLKPFDVLFGVYVELIRNTPFIVQLFFIFFGLPRWCA